ncbi:unnamed protein product [Bursaphelenchus xylophilus]|uniref:(pine wood nematode) hypothetical protein n=1 Tax=Bursaphelenchus xylophilus TaxID=6326 RepID=A0A1I7SCW5_BURXY|nr:unnamed protein product [Bursaphelenchus xylophilus]CAG9093353.1 unnamed protein product [Bursaphelenchus xylophilus]
MRSLISAMLVANVLVEAGQNSGLVYDRFYESSKDFGMNVTKESVAKCVDGTLGRASELDEKYGLKLNKYVQRFVDAVEKIPEDDLRGDQYGEAMNAFHDLVQKTKQKSTAAEQAWFDKTFLVVSSIYNGKPQQEISANARKLGLLYPRVVERMVEVYELGRAHDINMKQYVDKYLDAISDYHGDQTQVSEAMEKIREKLIEIEVPSDSLKFLDVTP